MNRQKRAFTLIEFTVYLALLGITVFLLFGFLSRMHEQSVQVRREQERTVRMMLALDILRRDIWSAGCKPHNWDENNFVFRKFTLNKKHEREHVDIGWRLLPPTRTGKSKLQRVHGEYDYAKHEWRKKRASLIVEHSL